VAEALEWLPQMRIALRDREISWSAARELTRVATPETEDAWLEATSGMLSREIEEKVGGREMGDLPSAPADERKRRHVLRIEMTAEGMATWREAVAKLRKNGLDEESAVLEMARQVLAPSDPGRSSYQLAAFVCKDCGQGYQQGDGGLVAVPAEAIEQAACDANFISDEEPARQSVTPALRRQVVARYHGRCAVPGCTNSRFLDVHHIHHQAHGGKHTLDNLILLCGAHHRYHHNGTMTHVGHDPEAAACGG
jgi:hypothetical protein